tara:strand:+ start:111 stop:722 length:612 start_codon:yes stop_codon:yes gene_type:complete
MSNEQFDKIGDYYNKLVKKHGESPKACDYGHPESQQIKFNVLSSIITPGDKSLLDVGCGLGNYYEFLREKKYNLNYTGIDLSEEMISKARNKYNELVLIQKNILDMDKEIKFDVVSANGIFYLLKTQPFDVMKELIAKMYLLANNTVVFNSLSSYCKDKEVGEFYVNPLEVVDYCMSLTPWVGLRHDYHHRDFTVYMCKTKNE